MDDDAPPILIGHAGLTGRQQIVRIPESEGVDEDGRVGIVKVGQAMPGNCRRVLSTPLAHAGCVPDCPGWQRNGGCLLDVVKAAAAQGVAWEFEVNQQDGFWDYSGPPVEGYEQTSPRPGVAEGAWLPGHGPSDPFDYSRREAPSFDCSWCDAHVVQDPENFHWWCPACGRNESEWERP